MPSSLGFRQAVDLVGRAHLQPQAKRCAGRSFGGLMYSWLWRKLQGGKLAKVLQLVTLATVVIFLLLTQIFPYLDAVFTVDPTLG
jgi:hypothetical protein